MIFAGGAVLIVACALQVAWVGRVARDRGREPAVWILVALMAAGAGVAAGVEIMQRAADADGVFVGLMGAIAPFPLALVAMLIVAGVLHRLPAHVAARREWKVSAPKVGDGTLVLGREAIELRWEDRTDSVARADVRGAVVDGECVRLTWTGGEVLLLPMMSPHTREGRIRQANMLAMLLTAPDSAPPRA